MFDEKKVKDQKKKTINLKDKLKIFKLFKQQNESLFKFIFLTFYDPTFRCLLLAKTDLLRTQLPTMLHSTVPVLKP